MKPRIFVTAISILVTLASLAAVTEVKAKDTIELAGDVLLVAVPVAAVGLVIGLKDGRGALELGEAAALSMGTAWVLQSTVEKTRPNGDDRSFPSGHAAFTFTAAEFMRKRYGWEYGLPAYALATFVAYSRVEADKHYAIDVIAGAAMGIASGYLFTRPYKGWDIKPLAGSSGLGLCFNRSW